MIQCARAGCHSHFEPTTHNMKYCCRECTRIATNKRVMEQYYEKQAQKQGKTRWCRSCQNTKLSRYNDSPICSACRAQREIDAKNSVVEMISNASFVL
jgi:hypothetical protein